MQKKGEKLDFKSHNCYVFLNMQKMYDPKQTEIMSFTFHPTVLIWDGDELYNTIQKTKKKHLLRLNLNSDLTEFN